MSILIYIIGCIAIVYQWCDFILSLGLIQAAVNFGKYMEPVANGEGMKITVRVCL